MRVAGGVCGASLLITVLAARQNAYAWLFSRLQMRTYLPKLGTNLITALAGLDVYDFCAKWV